MAAPGVARVPPRRRGACPTRMGDAMGGRGAAGTRGMPHRPSIHDESWRTRIHPHLGIRDPPVLKARGGTVHAAWQTTPGRRPVGGRDRDGGPAP